MAALQAQTVRREDWMGALDTTPPAEGDLLIWILDHLYKNHADLVRPVAGPLLWDMTRLAVRRARRWGVERETDTLVFVALMFTVAPNFDEHPVIRRLLEQWRADREQDLGLVLDSALDEHWGEVVNNANPAAWTETMMEA